MARTSTTVVPFQNWCDRADQYRTAQEAILAIDLQAQDSENPERELNVAWTAIVIWLNAAGKFIDPKWYSQVARFHRLSDADLHRVREAIEMRLRAYERAAA